MMVAIQAPTGERHANADAYSQLHSDAELATTPTADSDT